MTYRSPVNEFRFILENVVKFGSVRNEVRFAEATTELTDAILTEAAKLCDEVLAPLNRTGDLNPAKLENGVVRTAPGFAEGFAAIAEGGWVGITASAEYGGMELPLTLGTAVNEMMSGACLSLQLNPLLTQGQIEALEAHASDALKSLYLPKLISGEWTGTMNLTEPQAGSDVGALRTQARDNNDGTFAITGQKIFITWGDADFLPNVCHLVLARLPDAPSGTKGISLFLVPKYLPDDDGNPGQRNELRVVSLEHKLGIHGSPTAVMEYDGATGWMVGEENGGMAAMFTMMNNARLGVGVQGTGIAEAAYQKALEFAQERKQGRSLIEGGTGAIIDHADVRRMLMTMRAEIFAARSIGLACAIATDMENATSEPAWAARAAFLTPIAKAFCTDVGISVADLGVQIHGGMGFIEETGAAQFLRDARITSIYEGTNGIQAMDMVARKMMDGGAAAFALIDELEDVGPLEDWAAPFEQAVGSLRDATKWMLDQSELNERFSGAVPYLCCFARVFGASAHLKAAHIDPKRVHLARFYIERLLPEAPALAAMACRGSATLYDLSPEELAG